MQIYIWLCLGEGKDVVCRTEVEFENAEWRLVCHPPQLIGVIAVCMQSRCLALRSQLVRECQSWKGPVFRCLLSQLLASQVIAPSLGGAGAQGQSQDQPSGPWPPGPRLSCPTALPPCGCPSVPVCVTRGVSAGLCRGGGYL